MRIDAASEEVPRFAAGYLRQQVLEHKLVVLRGFAMLSYDGFLAFARDFNPSSPLLEWPTGPVMDVTIRDDAANYLFSREGVPFHWDGFFNGEPSFLIFQCVKAPADGGATLFTDAAKVWDLADDDHRRLWDAIELTYQTEKKAHYGGVATMPLVRRHPITARMTLRYAEPVATSKNPLVVTSDRLTSSELATLVDDLRSRIYDERVCHEHVWSDGDIAIADNHALLHGRTAIGERAARHLRRVQVL
jgi:alpha-ketoglutarate-dependent taurine dioxygenase